MSEYCRSKFLKRHTVEWRPTWKRALGTSFDAEQKRLRRGRDALVSLRAALEGAARFLSDEGLGLKEPSRRGEHADEVWEADGRRLDAAGPAATSLRNWFSDHLGGELWMPELDEGAPQSFRSYLVRLFAHSTRNGGEGLPEGLDRLFVVSDELRTRTMPTPRELAVISILCDQYPTVREERWKTMGITVGDVLGLEAHAMLEAREHALSAEVELVGYDAAHDMHVELEPAAVAPPLRRPRKK